MIILDNSGSMFSLAYPDGWHTDSTADDNDCTTVYCTDFTAGGTFIYPTNKYYGYFDPDYWYTSDGKEFTATAAKITSDLALPGKRAKNADEWDGNFLNWATMRRVDIVRKVLTGGPYTSSGNKKSLRTAAPDFMARGILKKTTNAALYTPYFTTGEAYFLLDFGTSDPSRFWVSEYSDFSTSDYIDVQVLAIGGITPTGIIHNTWTTIRWGLSYFHENDPGPEAGYVPRALDLKNSLSSFANDINGEKPDSNTPLAEVLWANVGYFAQSDTIPSVGGPGPNYGNDYPVNDSKDPMNHGTGGQPLYLSCGTNHILFITDGGPCADGNLPAALSDYANTRSAYNCQGSNCPAVGSFPASTISACGAGGNVAGIEDVALYAHTNDLRTPETKDMDGLQTLNLYPVFAFGSNSTLLKYAAINGGFTDSNGNNMPDLQIEWDRDSDNEPDNYYQANDGYALEQQLLRAINNILNKASSGSASSVIASTGDGDGAVYQALFIPGDTEFLSEANWRGYVQGLFVDKHGNIREDTNLNDTLDYTLDNIVEMFYDQTQGATKVNLYSDTNGDGTADGAPTEIALSAIKPIWEAGKILWAKSHLNRKIYTTIDGYSYSGLNVSGTKGSFHALAGNNSVLRPYLRAATAAEATNIINYIRGDNIAGYRTRSYTIGGTTDNWKLGDIIYSSPSLAATPAENFDLLYGDSTYATFRQTYVNRRQMIYTGANDGMVHAFNAGVYDPAALTFSGNGYPLGDELWAFIPRELLPHLKWLTDPEYTHVYYVDLKPKIVDARIFTSEFANPNGTHPYGWGTILIGGMRYGGKEICATDDFGSGNETKTFRSSYFALDITNPEQPPTLLWTFSHDNLPLTTSYPAVLRVGPKGTPGTWFTIFGSGPSDFNGSSTQRGHIFAVKLSGGDGVISSWTAGTNYWKSGVDFLTGGSNAILDDYAFMADPITIDIGTDFKVDTAYIGNNYCDNPIDSNDPAICSSSEWKGKMYRIVTKTSAGSQPSTNPADWTLSVLFDPDKSGDGPDGPISAAPSAAMDKKGNLWLFFGLGRYWHVNDRAMDCVDIFGTKCENWAFFGIKDTCKPWLDPTCTSDVINLYNSTEVDVCGSVTGDPAKQGGQHTTCTSLYGTAELWSDILSDSSSKNGWYLNFPPPGEPEGERALSKPLVLGGLITWTTYTPNPFDPCDVEGTGNVYATFYTTGTAYRDYTFDQSEGAIVRNLDLGPGVPSSVSAAITGSNSVMGIIPTSNAALMQMGQITPYGLKSRLIGWKSEGCE
jgi:type IV pilus assembly protein PilY1